MNTPIENPTPTIDDLIEKYKSSNHYDGKEILEAALIEGQDSENTFLGEYQEIKDVLEKEDEDAIDFLARNIIRSRSLGQGPSLYESATKILQG